MVSCCHQLSVTPRFAGLLQADSACGQYPQTRGECSAQL